MSVAWLEIIHLCYCVILTSLILLHLSINQVHLLLFTKFILNTRPIAY